MQSSANFLSKKSCVVSALIKGQMKQKQDSTALCLSFVSNTMIWRRK